LFFPDTIPETLFSLSDPGDEPMYDRIEILVDGSGDGHSVALFPGEEVFFSYERGASNNEAEFNAVILALENLPDDSNARIKTDSQVVVWHLSRGENVRHHSFLRKRAVVQDLIVQKNLKIDIQWIPRKQNRADRFLKHYIASLCGAAGNEPLYRRVRRLEHENLRLKAKLKRAMKMLERRNAFSADSAVPLEMFQ
jgi:ribonuclease HI